MKRRLLPGAFSFTGETRLPLVAAFRAAGTGIALATDCHPDIAPLARPLKPAPTLKEPAR